MQKLHLNRLVAVLKITFSQTQVHPEGKFVVDVDKNIDINDVSFWIFLILLMQNCIKKKNVAVSAPGDPKLPCGSAK